jgi:hypothetical protein
MCSTSRSWNQKKTKQRQGKLVAHPELKELDIPPDILRCGDTPMRAGSETILQFYLRIVAGGTHPRMAEALSMQQSPGIGVTDTSFIADQNRHGRSILDRMNGSRMSVEMLRRGLAKNGYKLRSDDHYIPTAARFASDPQAIVNNTQTFSDLTKRIRQRGTEFHGAVESSHAGNSPPKKKVRLNPRIVNRIDRHQVAENPDLAKISVRDRHAEIVRKHGSRPQKD